MVLKKSCDCPMNNPSSVRAFTAPIAAPLVLVGRMIEHAGNFRFRKGQGSGMMRFDCNDSGWLVDNCRNVTLDPVTGSTSVTVSTVPALWCQVWKGAVSVGPMLRRMRNTSTLVTRWASEG